MAADYETAQYALFRYPPSLAAAVLFTILFAATTFIHTYQLFRSRTWFFIPLLIGGYCTLPSPAHPSALISHPHAIPPFSSQIRKRA